LNDRFDIADPPTMLNPLICINALLAKDNIELPTIWKMEVSIFFLTRTIL